MTTSPLSGKTIPSPNHYNGRAYRITRITPHHMAGNLSVEACGGVFQRQGANASSNYGIGTDGRIACYVDEADAAWTSSSYDNDNRAVTIEVANTDAGARDGTWAVSDAAWASLVRLCADICRRNGIARLEYTGDTRGNLTEHRMFSSTSCPGPYLHARMGRLASEVNAELAGGGGVLQTWPANGSAAQVFHPEWGGDGWFALRSESCGKYLDVPDGKDAAGARVRLWPGNGSDAQMFKLVEVGKGYVPTNACPYYVVPKCAPSKVLDVRDGRDADGTAVQLWKRNGTKAQQWQVLDDGDGGWTLVSLLGAHRVLDNKDGA